ncbi:Membrane protein OS=Streptomyces aurantiogriseus OX=66870 GN=GCM10010251_50560 PE=4 SV=1 [Streptomyces aurantiogriseus]
MIFAINAFANGLLKLMRIEAKNEVTATFSDAELAQIVKDAGEAGLLDDRAQEVLDYALSWAPPGAGRRPSPGTRRLRARGRHAGGTGAARGESGFSRFPVVDEGDRIVGYLHVKDALDASPRHVPFRLRDLRPIARVRETTPLDDVLTAMRGSRTHLAAVLGADGRLAGLVTMEDVLRELFGQRA